MPIIVLILALAAFAYAMIVEPGFRRWGLIGAAAVGLGLAVYFWQTAPQAGRATINIAPEELTLDALEIDTSLRGATVTGRVLNGSADWRLREMTINVRLRDCPAPDPGPEAPAADCLVIGEASAIARPDAPPGQARGFTAHFIFTNLPPVAGVLDWDWRITETRATAD
jgi:hypothetical protein